MDQFLVDVAASRRLEDVNVAAGIARQRRLHRKRNLAVLAVVLWLVVDGASAIIPGPLTPTPIDDSIRVFDRIGSLNEELS